MEEGNWVVIYNRHSLNIVLLTENNAGGAAVTCPSPNDGVNQTMAGKRNYRPPTLGNNK